MPWLDPSLRTPETFASLPARLNKIGEQAKAAGLKTAYHNHDFEFQTYGASTTAMERLLAGTDPVARQLRARRLLGVQGGSRSGGAGRASIPAAS